MYDLAIKRGIIEDEEEYILQMADRQDFTINLTSMDPTEFKEEVQTQLALLAKKMELSLDKDKLLKTQTQLQSRKKNA